MSLDLDLTLPIRDVPSADLMKLKADMSLECGNYRCWGAGARSGNELERFLRPSE